ncbi:ABC-type cobalt transport system, permease component [Thermococcus kodakarensis KOD1]|uniref:ABC-type cobalt transport system, permease component n=1 Tax=Thermococcus kodakarensis (strain ATCC BAA-918 / JCM 12380 / KOD1) TaxID=69014 RepID=Q5JHD5_THEKO|nr:energy-coupling factor transporter transmembrane component T [Thermococcus kodakarensis]WCN28767.1 energy-coupling factor transporter transmembrane component T [Thermococcus kodakarensis]WCN31066.1 energy-coupling factor transporter transmembrane component T [Thermococcus kodakarensis]BAD84934.1 ABC-type cobalt transport system, permease component [Thermococcus kodakarensis KOD1]
MIGQFYIRKDSFMHSLDPRVKIIGMLLGIITLMLFNQPLLLLALFIGLLIIGKVLAGADFSYQFRLLKPLFPIVLITLALWPVIYKPRLEGFFIGIAYSARLLGFALVTFLLLMTTTQKELVLGFVRLGLPYELGLTLTIALRYIPTLYWLARTIMDAQRSRGLELDKGNLLTRMRKMTSVLIPLIVASLKTAHELSIALESRAFGASKKRTFLRDLEMKPRDYAVLALLLVGFSLALYARYVLGFGHVNLYQGGA